MTPASFLKRVAAFLIDSLIYGLVIGMIAGIIQNLVVTLLIMAFAAYSPDKEPSIVAMVGIVLFCCLFQLGIWIAYYVWPECSGWQATIGKKILGLRVTDTDGQRISFWRSLWRNFAKFFSAITLGIGYLMCLWTRRKQCLHDIMAKCLVLDTTPNEKKGCVIATIAACGLFFFFILIAGILAAIALPQYVKAVEKSRATQAISTLSTIAQSQQRHQLLTDKYAADWRSLDVSPAGCDSSTKAVCSIQNFELELQPDRVLATRTGDNDMKYRLWMAYDPEQTPRLGCEAWSQGARIWCRDIEKSYL